MLLKNVLKYAILYLGYSDQIDLDNPSTTVDSVKELKMLVRCANLTYQELLTDFFPAYITERVKFTNGFLPYTDLSEEIIDIRGLNNGGSIKYTADAMGIYADVDYADLTYSYMLPELTLDSYVGIDGRLTAKVFALGICAEYCLINNLFTESIAFDSRYREGLKNLLKKKTEIRLKERRWV